MRRAAAHLMVARIKELLDKPVMTEKDKADLKVLREAIGECGPRR